jgi:parvulin-like peptidyl-prolyl isomerase
LSAVKRTFVRLTLLTAAVTALSACATVTDGDVAARVGDAELSNAELTTLTRGQLGDEEAVRADMQTVIGILNNWVLDQVLRADLAANGSPMEAPDGELTSESLDASINESFGVWQQAAPTPISDDAVEARYSLGPVESNMICAAHVLVEDEDIADEVLARLDDGATFADTAVEFSFDSSAANGGNLPCGTTPDFAAQYIPEFVEAALEAEIGVPVGPVASQFGYHVIVLRPFDDLSPDELAPVLATPQVRFDFASTDVDVYVDSRYGTFNASSGILPLG